MDHYTLKRLPDVVLLSPAIAQNTGAIARTCAGLDVRLHLIKPLGFELTDRGLKRSGLDYWPYVHMCVHSDFDGFLEMQGVSNEQILFLSTKGEQSVLDFKDQMPDIRFLVFGREDYGFPKYFYHKYERRLAYIPTNFSVIRSHNLAISVGIALGMWLALDDSKAACT